MKFVTFMVKTLAGPAYRIGVLREGSIIDLHAAYASYLREVRNIWRWRELAQAIVPTDMLKFIEGGAMAEEAAQLGLDYFERSGAPAGQDGERHLYHMNEVQLMAPIPRPVSIRDCSAFPQHNNQAEPLC